MLNKQLNMQISHVRAVLTFFLTVVLQWKHLQWTSADNILHVFFGDCYTPLHAVSIHLFVKFVVLSLTTLIHHHIAYYVFCGLNNTSCDPMLSHDVRLVVFTEDKIVLNKHIGNTWVALFLILLIFYSVLVSEQGILASIRLSTVHWLC